MSKIGRCPTVWDVSRAARRRLPPFVFDYLEGGTGYETARHRDRQALDDVRLTPKGFVDVADCDPSVEIFGRRYSLPVGISPVGSGNLIWADADLILARLAARANIPYVLSTGATTSIERIAETIGGGAWFQLYPSTERAITDDLVHRAALAGFGVLVVTLDAPASAKRERTLRTGHSLRLRFTLPTAIACLRYPAWCSQLLAHGRPDLEILRKYVSLFPEMKNDVHRFGSRMVMPGVTGEEIRRIRNLWQGPLVLKGVLSGEMAADALSLGADGVMVSNHGGRQFDAGPAPIDALREVADAVGGRTTILFDGGMRSGTDVLRAKALGARMAFSGRPFFYGVAAFGRRGAAHVLNILSDDVTRGLKQLGCPRFEDLDGRWLSACCGDRAWTDRSRRLQEIPT